MRLAASFAFALVALAADRVTIPSSYDGYAQPALVVWPPTQPDPAPLLVYLHSWSATYDNSGDLSTAVAEAARRQWAFLSPDFRGPNNHPLACGSDASVQDVIDAVAWVSARARIDPRRIYLVGGSGGGFMALVLAGRRPKTWAAVSAWVPISDLAAWHEFSRARGARYAAMLEACFSAPPSDPRARREYRRRSPVSFLHKARGLPLDIQAGIQDGHTGSVPVSHSLRAFNAVAARRDRIRDADIEIITRTAAIPQHLAHPNIEEERKHPVLFRRSSKSARLTLFQGGHETDFAAAIAWLEHFPYLSATAKSVSR